MAEAWAALPAALQDALVAAGFLLPSLLLGAPAVRGFRPWGLARAMLWRFRAANLVFSLLISAAVALGVGLTAQERALRQGSARAA